jgi:hypothetical protein
MPLLNMKSMKKLYFLAYSLLGLCIITIYLIIIDKKSAAAMFGAITYGACFSSMFPLLLAIPS